MPHPWTHSTSGWAGLWVTWSSWSCSCSLQRGSTRWPSKVPSNSSCSRILWFCGLFWQGNVIPSVHRSGNSPPLWLHRRLSEGEHGSRICHLDTPGSVFYDPRNLLKRGFAEIELSVLLGAELWSWSSYIYYLKNKFILLIIRLNFMHETICHSFLLFLIWLKPSGA